MKDVKMTTTHTHRYSTATRGWRRMGAALALSGITLLASGSAVAQDNDDDGVLPFHDSSSQEGNVSGGAGGGGSSAGATASTTIGISGSVDDGTLDSRHTHLELSTAAGGTDVAVDEDLEGATFSAEAGGLNVAADEQSVRLQGRGELSLHEGLEARLHAAPDALARLVLLVLDDGQDSLQDVLAGQTQPALILSMGDLVVADLVVFQRILSHHAADLPGVHATLVFGSVDAGGELHLAAVRGGTDGEPLEVLSK
jgi:hypothetical protein